MNNLFDYNKFKSLKINESVKGDSIEDFLPYIDYTELGLNLPEGHIKSVCEKAIELGVSTVCVQPENAKESYEILSKSDVGVCSVISFPEGTNSKEEKINECKQILDYVTDIDMVLNWKELKNLGEEYFETGVEEVESLADLCHDKGKILKVIVESSELSEQQVVIATEICMAAGADFIKTSTGFAPNGIGAELNKIKVMYETINDTGADMKIKASGGVKDLNKIRAFSQFVDRYGIGYKSVDNLLSGEKNNSSY